MYKDLIERLCKDERLADANSLLYKLIDKGYGFDHASFMPVIDGLSKRGNKRQADELAKRMMELELEDRPVDRTYSNRKRVIPGKLHKDGGSDWQDIINQYGHMGDEDNQLFLFWILFICGKSKVFNLVVWIFHGQIIYSIFFCCMLFSLSIICILNF